MDVGADLPGRRWQWAAPKKWGIMCITMTSKHSADQIRNLLEQAGWYSFSGITGLYMNPMYPDGNAGLADHWLCGELLISGQRLWVYPNRDTLEEVLDSERPLTTEVVTTDG